MSIIFFLIGFVALLEFFIYLCDKDDSEEEYY